MTKPDISIIIPVYDGERFINDCLQSIFRSEDLNYEVIFVNDGSRDKTAKILNKLHHYQNIKIFNLKKNRGAAFSRNFGAGAAKGRYLIFLDVDCMVKKDSLAKLVAPLKKDESIGSTQGLLLNPDNSIETAGHFLTVFGFPYNLDSIPRHHSIFGSRTSVAISKKLFKAIGGYDDDYMIYGEDTDLSWRVWLAGYKVSLVPQSTIYHRQKSSLSEKTRNRLYYEGAKNMISNILKNAPLRIMVWILPLHILAWILISLKLILEKRFSLALWIYRGIFWNVLHINKTIKKRQSVRKYLVDDRLQDIMFGNLGSVALVKKGWRWFFNA